MSLNIKDPEAHKLARKLAEETGQTMTREVSEALNETLGRVRKERNQKLTVEELLAIVRRLVKYVGDCALGDQIVNRVDVGGERSVGNEFG